MAVMAILQEIDKCMRCNGCVISCKRTWKMKTPLRAGTIGVHKVDAQHRVIIKSQKRVDNGPWVRYSCWHCPKPPCAGHCPKNAIIKEPSGAVYVDPTLCKPAECQQQCFADCQRGGYPKVGDGSELLAGDSVKAWKCTLCHTRAGIGGDLPTRQKPVLGVYYSYLNGTPGVQVDELAHEPSCVYTCPAKAMIYDTRDNILAYIAAKGFPTYYGDGSMFWASNKFLVSPPKADPYVEDHISPMVGSLLSGPFAKAALVPTLVAGGIMAIAARRAKLEDEASLTVGEVR